MPEPAEPGSNERLRELLDDAFTSWLAEVGGGYSESYYLTADFVMADGSQRWTYVTPPEQKLTTTLGLQAYAALVADEEGRLHLRSDPR